MRLFALAEDNSRRELQIEELWPHKGNLVLKFRGVGSISDAETLLRCELQIPRGERAPLESGAAYISDLIGCAVFDGEQKIGIVDDVQFGAGDAPLLVVRSGKSERSRKSEQSGKSERSGKNERSADDVYEIPYAEAYLKSVDLERKEVHMLLPEGMLQLNAPLTAEEKQQQQESARKSET